MAAGVLLQPGLLLPLLVVLPAGLAAILLLPGAALLRVVPSLAVALQAVLLLALGQAIGHEQRLLVWLGGWDAPLGIGLRADGLALAFMLMTTAVMAAVLLHQWRAYSSGREGRIFWALLLFLWSGLNTVYLSHDLFNLYVALEIAGLGGVALVALSGATTALVAQMRYLLLATMGSLFYLLGVALIYAALGVLDLTLVAEGATAAPVMLAALALITLGLLLKAAIWPLHLWLPPAHSSALPPISAVLSALAVKAPLYLLLRLWFEVFPNVPGPGAWTLLGVLGAVAVLWGSLLALRQERLKLMIAYSTVAQLGYLLFVFPLAQAGGGWGGRAWSGALLHLLSHGIAKAAMFLAAGALVLRLGSDQREAMSGASRLAPVPLFALALAGLSIMALPPSGGFLAKWLLLSAALEARSWWQVAVLLVGGLLAAGYLLRFILPAFRPPSAELPEDRRATGNSNGFQSAAAMSLACLSLLLGLAAQPLIELLSLSYPGAGEISP